MIHLVSDINHNLQVIKDWFKELHKDQQESIATQLGDSFPFLIIEESHQTTPAEFINFIERHLQTSSSNLRKSLLFYTMIRGGIEIILYDLPSSLDEYLDWYNIRKSFFDQVEQTAKKHGLESGFSNREDFMKKQIEMFLHTKTSWQEAITKLKF